MPTRPMRVQFWSTYFFRESKQDRVLVLSSPWSPAVLNLFLRWVDRELFPGSPGTVISRETEAKGRLNRIPGFSQLPPSV